MNSPWAICVALDDAASLAPLRQVGGVEVGEAGETIWLRGKQSDGILNASLAALPARARYEWLDSDQLRQIDQRIPGGHLPKLQWRPLEIWLQVEMPQAAAPAELPNPVPMRLVRSTHEQAPELLLAHLDELVRFASMAARARLERLQFAANATGMALVRGRPLPAVPGQRFVLHGSVAVPVGFSWEPRVASTVLARCFGVSSDALVVWHEGGTTTRLHSEQFIPLSRSALRATQQALPPAR